MTFGGGGFTAVVNVLLEVMCVISGMELLSAHLGCVFGGEPNSDSQ